LGEDKTGRRGPGHTGEKGEYNNIFRHFIGGLRRSAAHLT